MARDKGEVSTVDQGVIIAIGVVVALSIAVLFFQVASLAGRMDDVEGRLHIVERKTRNIDDILSSLNSLDVRLREVSEGLRGIDSDFSEMKEWIKKKDEEDKRMWSEIMRVEKEINNVKESFNAPIPPLLAQFVNVKLQSGDTLAKISEAFELGDDGVRILMELNSIRDPRTLKVGEVVKVPTCLSEVATLPFEGRIEKGTVEKGFDETGWVYFRLPPGTVVRASMPGRIDVSKPGYVKIYHGSGVTTSYKWIGKIDVSEGDWVKAGQEIGILKNGVLMFALMVDGEPRDPFRVLFSYKGTFETSFYSEWEDGILPEQATFKLTRSGELVQSWWTIAADPSVIPLGSIVYIPEFADTPSFGIFKVQDTGALVKSRRIDVYVPSIPLALSLSRREVRVYVYKGN